MKKIAIHFIILLCLSAISLSLSAEDNNRDSSISWSRSSSRFSFPGSPAISRSGVQMGCINGTFILSGGMYREGPAVHYSDSLFLLKTVSGSDEEFEKTLFRLKQKTAFAGYFSAGNRMIWAGGENEKGLLTKVAMLQWDEHKKIFFQSDLPDLPVAIKNPALTVYNNIIYVAGGETAGGRTDLFLSLDLSQPRPGWKNLFSLPFACSNAALGVQSNGENPCLYLAAFPADENLIKEKNGTIAYYDFKVSKWKLVPAGNSVLSGHPVSCIPFSGTYLLLIGRSDRNTPSGNESGADSLLLYNTITQKLVAYAALPFGQAENVLLGNGQELSLLNFTAGNLFSIWTGKPVSRSFFTIWDYLVVLSYLVLTIIIGLKFSGKQVSTSQYFKGGGNVPTWAVGLSIIGAQLSAITFMSTPAKAYATNWNYFFLIVSVVFILPLVNRCFIPFYRKLNVTSAYEYLDKRFNYTIRSIASMAYILFELGRLSIILILPSLALAVVTGLEENICVLIIGLITLMYTFKGGIKAVIWTDVMQVCVLLGGAFLCAIYILAKLPVGLSDIYQNIQVNQKIRMMDTGFDLTSANFWVVIVGGFTLNFLAFSTDQTTVQRYLTTKNEESAKRSARIAAWLSVPAGIIFLCIGTLLYLYFYYHPADVNVVQASNDSIFPWYIVSQLPTGIRGLLIAGIFAAAMSSLGSSLASASTAFITDFYKIFRSGKSDKDYLRAARTATLLIGFLGILIALYVVNKGHVSLWDQYNFFMSLFTGGIGGIFLLGIFTVRANSKGVLAGLVISVAVQYWLIVYTSLHFLLYAFIGLAVCFIAGWLLSLFFPADNKNITGLTLRSG